MYGLYAIPSLVDSNVVTITATGPDGPLLLGGPHAPEEPQPYPDYVIPGRNYKITRDLYDENFQSLTITSNFKNHIIVYTGHYNRPEFSSKKFMIPGRYDAPNLITDASVEGFIGPKNRPVSKQTQTDKVYETRSVKPQKANFFRSVNQTYADVKHWVNQQDNKGLKLTLIILSGCVVAMFWYLQMQVRVIQNQSQNGSRSSQLPGSVGKNGQITAVAEELPDGHVKVGKITFNPEQLLGKGCEGTFVYRYTNYMSQHVLPL